MLEQLRLEHLICIDIETVPEHADFDAVSDELQQLYLKKSERLKEEGETPGEQYFNHAGIYAEFGKVVCITMGLFKKQDKAYQLRLKSLYGDDEKKLLQDFLTLTFPLFKNSQMQFCGHNVREFDIPFLCRRLLIHQLSLPPHLDISGRKPWEVSMTDTMLLWRFGDFKHFTSLKLLALTLGIASPKDDMEGKDVGRVYWREKGLQRIVEYCQRDVVTVAQLMLRFKGMKLLEPVDIVIVT